MRMWKKPWYSARWPRALAIAPDMLVLAEQILDSKASIAEELVENAAAVVFMAPDGQRARELPTEYGSE